MASRQLFALFASILILPAITGATEHIVGGDQGWAMGVNYRNWAKDREFFVGDTLVFKYFRGDHNVIEVDEAGFKACQVPPGEAGLASGKDVVALETPGKRWFICGMPSHCTVADQKLAITVRLQPLSPASPPSIALPPSAAYRIAASGYLLLVAVVMAMVAIALV